MNPSIKNLRHCLIGALALSLLAATPALAGPPLVCHPFAIGKARTLPFTDLNSSVSDKGGYDLNKLVPDTLEILNSTTPVLVRMETMRRATLYARRDLGKAKELLAKLHARATAAQNAGHPDALAFFDVGYLAETYKQWLGKESENLATGMDGYGLVKKAIELRGEDPPMEFAAALITLSVSKDSHRDHVLRANAGAKKDPLLAENLASHSMGGST